MEISFVGEHMAVIVGKANGAWTTPDGYMVAIILEALKQAGYKINSWNYAEHCRDVQNVVIDYEFPEPHGEEDV